MRLEDLTLFRRAAALGVLSAAGRELGLSPASASARLQALEKSVGATLFTRSTRRLALTEEGETLLAHAERALDELDIAQATLQAGAARPAGLLRISSVESFALKHVVPHVPAFMAAYPEIRLDLHVTDALVNLSEGGFELAIRGAPLADSALLASKLAPNRRALVASPDYVARRGAPEQPEALADHDCVIHSQVSRWRLCRGQDPAREERVPRLRPVFHSNSSAITRDAAIAGLGIALKSLWDVGEELRDGRLVRVLPDWEVDDAGAIWAVRPPARFPSPRAKALITFLKDLYGSPPYWECD